MKNRAIALNNLWVQLWTAVAAVSPDRRPPAWLREESDAWIEWWEANKLSMWTLVLGPDLAPWITRYNAARERAGREFPRARLPSVARDTSLLTAPRQVQQAAEEIVQTAAGGLGLGIVVIVGLWALSKRK